MNDTTTQTSTTQTEQSGQTQAATTEQSKAGTTLLTQTDGTEQTQQLEQKTEGQATEGDKKAEGEKKPETKDAPALDLKALKMPEGVTIDEKQLGQFSEILTKDMTPQERAQSLIDFHAAEMRRLAEAPLTAWNEAVKTWTDTVAKDKEIGSGDPKSPLKTEAKASIAKFIDAYGGQELRDALDLTGAGTNPAIIKAFWKAAQKLTEGGHVAGNGPVPTKPQGTGASALYPDLKP